MHYAISEVKMILNGQFQLEWKEHIISAVAIDSRQINHGSAVLFFALIGRNDGHHYIKNAYLKGVRNFIISRGNALETYPDANFILVEDTTLALQQLAAYHRKQFDIDVIGITGSNGKTIVKEWLYQLLHHDKNIVKSPKSYNSQIGVPLSVLNMEAKNELAIFEAGISTIKEMQALTEIIQPTIGIFTNIGSAHDAGFKNEAEKIAEKIKLFKEAEVVIYCSDYSSIQEAISKSDLGTQFIDFGRNPKAKVQLEQQEIQYKTTLFRINATLFNISDYILHIPFTDKASVENCLHCVVLMLQLGYDISAIQEKIKALRNLPMRLELKYGINNCTIIDDSYSADFYSLQIAFDFLKQQETHKKKTLIISEFEESGLLEKEYISKLKSALQQSSFDKIIGVGKTFIHAIEALSGTVKEWYVFESTEQLLQQFHVLKFEDEIILLKGARKFTFEKITARLIGQTHATALEINLNALIHNLNVYKSHLNKDCGIVAMVKAFSYGSGSSEIARLLEKQKVDYLAVAYTDEGVVLRKDGIQTPMMVMNPDAVDFDRMIENRLEPEMYSLHILEQLVAKVDGKPMNIHLKLETGMNRLGFTKQDEEALISCLKKYPNIKVKTIFSHLAGSEDPSLDSFTEQQIHLFQTYSSDLITQLGYPIKRHLLNSAGVLRFPQAYFDYIRLGIGLYGVDTSTTIQHQLQPIGKLKTRISQIKQVAAGETIGYSRKGIAEEDLKVGVLAIGYADGYDRRFGNGIGEVFIAGQKAKIIGNICMDMCMVDITHIEDVNEGDEAEIYGNEISIIEAARKIGTIAYELLTRISSRVKRLYYLD